MPVHLLDDLCPDGLRIVIPWKDLQPGMSVFVPCVNLRDAKWQALSVAKRHGIEIRCITRVEDYKLGLRIWRTA